jgi:hypothetical protein
MGNLVHELGDGYIRERFERTMFFDEKEYPCFIDPERRADGKSIPIIRLTGTVEEPVSEKAMMPYDFFKDLGVFKIPDLGWRMANEGRYLAHFRRNNRMNQTGYKRGLTPANLEMFVSPATEYLQETDNLSINHYIKPEVEVLLVMKPKYVRFRDGIAAMQRGDLYSFCTSPMVAVIPSLNNTQAVYFNTRQVATIEKGDIVCSNKIMEKYLRDTL